MPDFAGFGMLKEEEVNKAQAPLFALAHSSGMFFAHLTPISYHGNPPENPYGPAEGRKLVVFSAIESGYGPVVVEDGCGA